MIKAIIVDDMPLAIANLRADIDNLPLDLEIIGTANGVIEAAKLLKHSKPDLIFLDIHMGDGDGFDLLNIISTEGIHVIFTTASQDHAIKAFQHSATDYLLKPVDPEFLLKAVNKVKQDINSKKESIIPSVNTEKTTNQEYISLNTQEEIRVLAINDIIRLEAMGNYTTFYIKDGSKILITKTLKDFESKLPATFLRVHQSHLVNRFQIKAYIKTEGGYLRMKEGKDVPVSVRKKAYVMEILKV